MDRRKKSIEKTTTSEASIVEASPPISASEVFMVNLLCGPANSVYSIDLVTDPSLTLFFIWIIELPIVILLYSRYRQNPQQCTYLRAVRRGILGVPIVPASCVLGGLTGNVYLRKQTHGAVIGGWFGAWPMPLDWERPWQEWPISVSYGSLAGYLVALVASWALFLLIIGCNMSKKNEVQVSDFGIEVNKVATHGELKWRFIFVIIYYSCSAVHIYHSHARKAEKLWSKSPYRMLPKKKSLLIE